MFSKTLLLTVILKSSILGTSFRSSVDRSGILQGSAFALRASTLTHTGHHKASQFDHWSFSANDVDNKSYFQGITTTFRQALDRLPMGNLPDVCIINFPSKLANGITIEDHLRSFDFLLSSVPSIQSIVGVVVEDPNESSSVQMTLGTLSGRTVSVFHVDSIPEGNQAATWLNSLLPKSMQSSPRSYLLFPHASVPLESVVSLIDTIDMESPNSFRTGSFLSENSDKFSGFLVERRFPDTKVTFVKSGLLGVAVSADIRQIENSWPAWSRSLVPLLRWSNLMGH